MERWLVLAFLTSKSYALRARLSSNFVGQRLFLCNCKLLGSESMRTAKIARWKCTGSTVGITPNSKLRTCIWLLAFEERHGFACILLHATCGVDKAVRSDAYAFVEGGMPRHGYQGIILTFPERFSDIFKSGCLGCFNAQMLRGFRRQTVFQ